jgi:two-component sensor histidine kinase
VVARERLSAVLAEKEASLAANETLLREVHHRVKNNLQMVCDLIYLQLETMPDRDQHQALQDTYRRIYAIARLHEQLYQSLQAGTIVLAEYLARLLTGFKNFFPTFQVRLDPDGAGVVLDVDRAIHVGLIVNELVTNAVKHAFPKGQNGAVTVAVRALDDKVELQVRDNGRGLPTGLDFERAKSLGLRMVGILARRLNATLRIENEAGTCFTLTFPLRGHPPLDPKE